jgi:putative endopeptidase
MNYKLLLPAAAALVLGACGGGENKPTETSLKGVDRSFLDTTVKPGEDFFAYANNGWLKKTEIPASEGVWGIFSVLRDEVNDKLKKIAEDAQSDKSASKGSNKQLVGDFYASGMDTAKIEQEGMAPLKEELDRINGMKDKKELAAVAGDLHAHFVFVMFSMYVNQDSKQSTRMVPILNQGGIGLPERDYYFLQDEESKKLREKYVTHVKNDFVLLGESEDQAKKDADEIMKLETALAKASWALVDARNPQKTYNKMKVADLNKLCPSFDWTTFMSMTGVKEDSIVVSEPSFFTDLDKTIRATSLDTWKKYFAYGYADDASPRLSSAFEKENFDFYEKTLTGVTEMKPRWKRILTATDRYIGDALGQLFVEKHFTADAKKRVTEMVDNLIAVYKERIDSRDWMGADTKANAKQKLEKIMKKLGYPDKFKDYQGLDISRDSYAKNAWNSAAWGYKFMIGKLGKPVDRTEWGMTPPTINAYYNPSMNEIVFPAGIMQYPFFDIGQDDALNYGAMGAVIGHELTHGFDDQGSQFNSDGNMVNWWTSKDSANFASRTNMIVNQFNQFVAIDTLHVKGRLTLGENIADLGGLTIAYYAYQRSLNGKKGDVVDGFTPEQRFFLGWARGWCVKFRPEFLRKQVMTNEHAPGNFRVIGPLSNMQEFYDAFGIKEGDKMYRKPEDRAVIW